MLGAAATGNLLPVSGAMATNPLAVSLAWSTLLASAIVGVLTSLLRETCNAPFAAIAFGAVVPLVPDALRAASGTVQLVEAVTPRPALLVETPSPVSSRPGAAGDHRRPVTPVALVRRTSRTTSGQPIDA